MMLIFLTFGMLVFLHDSELVSINLEDNLTWFLTMGNNSRLLAEWREKSAIKNPILYRRNGNEG
jgi:hypothetical protein